MTRDRRILFFGDSFVAGVGDPTGLGWVGRVVAASHAAGRPLTAYNLGVRRDTSRDVAQRWQAEARARMGAADASYGVVFALGTNDTSADLDDRPFRLSHIILARLIDQANELGIDIFVVGPPPVGEPTQDDRIRALSRRFADVADRAGVPFVETVTALMATPAWTTEAAANDGSHPGAGGYQALAQLVLGGGWPAWLG